MATFKFENNDKINEAVSNAASVLCDEYYIQNGMETIARTHTEEWFALQEALKKTILKETNTKLLAYFMLDCI